MHRLIHTKPTPRVLRQFAVAWLVFFVVLSVTTLWKRHSVPLSCVFAIVALFGIVGIIKPNAIRLPFIFASVVTYPIGWLMSQILLALMFYGVITPIGCLWRIRGRDPLQLRGQPKQSIFWITRTAKPPPQRYLKPF